METIRCPFCDCTVRLSEVDNEDGVCPECGSPLIAPTLFVDADATAGSDAFEEEEGAEEGLDIDGAKLDMKRDANRADD